VCVATPISLVRQWVRPFRVCCRLRFPYRDLGRFARDPPTIGKHYATYRYYCGKLWEEPDYVEPVSAGYV